MSITKSVNCLEFTSCDCRIIVRKPIRLTSAVLFIQFFFLLTDEDKCNETIFLGGTTVAGKLVYNHSPTVSENTCDIFIKTEPGHRIGYSFKQTTSFREIFIHNNSIFYTCTSVSWSADGMERFGCDKRNYTDMVYTTSGDTLTIRVRGDNLSHFKFELVFFTFHFSDCSNNEIRCYSMMESVLGDYRSACVDRTLACDQAYKFCDTTSSSCTDIVVDDFSLNLNGSLIAAIVLLCIILIPLISLSIYMGTRKLCKSQEPEEDTPTRARRIFAAILEEAEGNAGYDTGSIDPSKFDPPPEYGSLEHIDGAAGYTKQSDERLSQISIESPPCYNDVMSNSTEYLVTNHI